MRALRASGAEGVAGQSKFKQNTGRKNLAARPRPCSTPSDLASLGQLQVRALRASGAEGVAGQSNVKQNTGRKKTFTAAIDPQRQLRSDWFHHRDTCPSQ